MHVNIDLVVPTNIYTKHIYIQVLPKLLPEVECVVFRDTAYIDPLESVAEELSIAQSVASFLVFLCPTHHIFGENIRAQSIKNIKE